VFFSFPFLFSFLSLRGTKQPLAIQGEGNGVGLALFALPMCDCRAALDFYDHFLV